ncbi:MAG: hypothetical protein SFX19_07655 [Alphaproteobacteria bacterium]|nr:hypothetical protein [Alphaproteobacteria bacterium]
MTLTSQKRTIFSNPWVALLVALAVTAVTAITSMMDEKGRASIDLSMNGSRPLYGLVIATSHYQFGSPLYGFYTPVFDTFYTKQTHSWKEVDALIKKARAIDPATLTSDKLYIGFGELNEDDKGTILWYWAAFGLFGPHLGSIYLLYFLMLAASLGAFWLSFKKDEPALLLMTLYPLVHLLLAAFTLASNTNVTGSLLGARPFAMLAALPALHLALLILRNRAPSRWLVTGAAVQILYLLLIIAVRSSAKIQILFILLVAAFALLRWIKNTGRGRRMLASAAVFRHAFVWVPLALTLGLSGMTLAYNIAVPQELRARAATGHLVWYPALAGFVANEKLYDELLQFSLLYKPEGMNTGVYDAKGNVIKSPSSDALARMSVIGFAKSILHEDMADAVVGGPDKRNPNIYESYARRMFFYELRQHPADIAKLYAIDKTRNLLGMMKNMLRDLQLADVFVAAFVLGLLGGAVWLQGLRMVAPLLAAGFGVSSIPAYWFIAAPHVMYDYVPYFTLGLLYAIAVSGAWISLLITRHALLASLKPLLGTVLPVALTLAIAGMLLAIRLPGAEDKSTIVIISATYGANVKAPTGNATDPMRRACNGHEKCTYKVDVNLLGDPMGGAAKDFVVEYECSYEMKPVKETIPAEAHNHKILLDCRT